MAEEITIDISKDKGNSVRAGSVIDEKIAPSVWEELTPMISNGNKHDVYLNSEIIAPVEYSKLVHFLGMLGKKDKVTLHINNPGGYVDTGFMIVGALVRCKAEVTARLSGTVASVATIITMACDKIDLDEHMQFMIHSWSGGIAGKAEEIRVHAKFSDKELTKSFNKIYKGFLSKSEMRDVMKGKDMWLNKSDVLKRWDNKQKVGKE